MPPGSTVWALANGIPPGWTLTDILLTDVYAALSGQEHPARPSVNESVKQADLRDKVARLKEQRERLRRS